MFSKPTIIVNLACLVCFVVLGSGTRLPLQTNFQQTTEEFNAPEAYTAEYPEINLIRHARSPEGGKVRIDYSQDNFEKRGSVEYDHNLYSSGRGSIDAYARGERDFTNNRNDFGAGIRGSFRF